MLLTLFLLCFQEGANDFRKNEMSWRENREASMREETSWMNVVGLYWLKEGENTFGTKDDRNIVLPMHTTVERAGSLFVEGERVRYEMRRGQRATINDEPANKGDLKIGEILHHNNLRMFVIERDGRLALRVRDLRGAEFLNFKSLNFYRPKKRYRISADFEPFEEPRKIKIATVIDTELELLIPGTIRFKLKGKEYTLLPTLASLEAEEYFIIFKDKTAGDTTYGAGRFLYAPRPENGKIEINFNRAINPPCAYTDYATCPIPPEENFLDIAIEAGEKIYKVHEETLETE